MSTMVDASFFSDAILWIMFFLLLFCLTTLVLLYVLGCWLFHFLSAVGNNFFSEAGDGFVVVEGRRCFVVVVVAEGGGCFGGKGGVGCWYLMMEVCVEFFNDGGGFVDTRRFFFHSFLAEMIRGFR